MAREKPLKVIQAARSIERLPDGSPISSPVAHALLVLASYYPEIWPSQARLAADMKVTRSSVNKRLKQPESAGLIDRLHRGRNRSTLYRLNLEAIQSMYHQRVRDCIPDASEDVSLTTQEYQYKSNERGAPDDVAPDPWEFPY